MRFEQRMILSKVFFESTSLFAKLSVIMDQDEEKRALAEERRVECKV